MAGYVTLDESVYRNLQFGDRGDFDYEQYDSSYVQPVAGPDDVPPYGWTDLTKRPEHPPYSKLWGSFLYPLTPLGMFLWKDGTVRITNTWFSDDYLTADDHILGGHIWFTPDDSWQAQVLTDAGYPLVPHEGPHT